MIARDEKQSSAAATEAATSPAPEAAAPEAAAPEAAAPAAAPGLTTKITAGPGGVMTDEVGVITGELTLQTEVAEGKVVLKVQYFEADEWYTVTGGKATLKEPADAEAVHKVAVGLLDRPEG
jgi:3-oxoacyl-ACP reductase-like protein